jgi:PIN domain nuclease of toxin-antitoxin system
VSGGGYGGGVLLDTCAVIWLANGDAMAPAAIDAIVASGGAGGIFVSPVSAWEIGMLSRAGAARSMPMQFMPDPVAWFDRLLAGPGIRAAPFSPAIAIAASFLPGALHRDPGDRLLVSTARFMNVPLVTRDTKLLEYAAQGLMRAIAC